MQHPKVRIIIAGAGICGLAAAVALRRPGREIIVLEQSRLNKEIGALISLQPNAFKIAAKLGIDQHLPRDQITTDKGFCIYDKDGNRLRTIDFDLSQPTSIRAVFHRVDLHDALKRAAIAEDGFCSTAISRDFLNPSQPETRDR